MYSIDLTRLKTFFFGQAKEPLLTACIPPPTAPGTWAAQSESSPAEAQETLTRWTLGTSTAGGVKNGFFPHANKKNISALGIRDCSIRSPTSSNRNILIY